MTVSAPLFLNRAPPTTTTPPLLPTTESSPIFVGDWPRVFVKFATAGAASGRIQLNWYDSNDVGGRVLIDSRSFDVRPVGTVWWLPFNLGRWVTWQVYANGGPATFGLVICGADLPPRANGDCLYDNRFAFFEYPLVNQVPGQVRTNLPAYSGEVHVWASPPAANSTVWIDASSYDHTLVKTVEGWKGAEPANAFPRRVWLPPLWNELVIENLNAGTVPIQVHITPCAP